MKLLRVVGIWLLAGGFALATAGGAKAQNNNSNSQNSNSQQTPQPASGTTGSLPGPGGDNVPYTPPAPPPGGNGNAETGSYSGKGTSGYGPGSSAGSMQSSSVIGHIGRDNPLAEDTPQNQQQMEMQQARARNAERQKQLLADTQKLVALANELQNEVNSSSKDMLSLDVVRKADEIDKLARNVRDKMKNAN